MSNKNWIVYLVRCSDKSLYCGISNDYKNRLIEHNSGKGAKYTRSRRPVKLIGISPEMTKSEALKEPFSLEVHMSAEQFNLANFVISCIQVTIIVFGGYWAYRRFIKERTHKPHIEFGIDCNFYGPKGEDYIAEFVLTANNLGLVFHKFQSIRLRVLGIREKDPLKYWRNGYRVNFPAPLFSNYELTQSELDCFDKNGIPKELQERLIKLENDAYRSEDDFSKTLDKEIGKDNEHKKKILKCSKKSAVEVIHKKNLNYLFVEPGVKQEIRYITLVPKTYEYIVAHAVFEYDRFTPHDTERLFAVTTKQESHKTGGNLPSVKNYQQIE